MSKLQDVSCPTGCFTSVRLTLAHIYSSQQCCRSSDRMCVKQDRHYDHMLLSTGEKTIGTFGQLFSSLIIFLFGPKTNYKSILAWLIEKTIDYVSINRSQFRLIKEKSSRLTVDEIYGHLFDGSRPSINQLVNRIIRTGNWAQRSLR